LAVFWGPRTSEFSRKHGILMGLKPENPENLGLLGCSRDSSGIEPSKKGFKWDLTIGQLIFNQSTCGFKP